MFLHFYLFLKCLSHILDGFLCFGAVFVACGSLKSVLCFLHILKGICELLQLSAQLLEQFTVSLLMRPAERIFKTFDRNQLSSL